MGKTHFIGIGGIGMSGLANILLDQKKEVSGSDISSTSITESLKKKGAEIFLGHDPENITTAMAVIFSSGISQDNPEYKTAVKLKCRVWHRSELLWQLMKEKKSLAVTGTHGKTTTSALLAWVLISAGLDPSFCVGGILPELDVNGRQGSGDLFVAEADESDGTFLRYRPQGAIVTNIGFDHMNHFLTEEKLLASFKQFAEQVESTDLLFWGGDDKRLRKIDLPGISYGFDASCDLQCSNYRQEGWKSVGDITYEKKKYSDVSVNLIGKHNMLNAAAVFGLCLRLGVPEKDIRKGLDTFCGVRRRCEKKGEVNTILFFDDYAHHPTEIKTTLEAIRNAEPQRRLIAVFQPHRYSRTKDCLGLFGTIFDSADELIVTDVHAAGEAPIPNVSAYTVLEEVQSASSVASRYVSRDKIVEELACKSHPNDLVVTLGAGNITYVSTEAIAKIQKDAKK